MNSKFTVRKVGSIVCIEFPSSRAAAKAMLRFQVRYECPKFRNKVFTLGEYREWYKSQRNGRFTYYNDWAGFNLSGDTLKPFKKGLFDPLSPEEKEILKRVKKYKGKFYVIASPKRDIRIFRHELAHAFYYLYPSYKRQIDAIIQKSSQRRLNKLSKYLIDMGYSEHVLQDEIQAYVASDDGLLVDEGVNLSDTIHQESEELLDKYIKRVL